MEKSEYQEFLEFKEFLRIRQNQNSQSIGRIAASSKPPSTSSYGEDTLDYMTPTEIYYDNQGYRE